MERTDLYNPFEDAPIYYKERTLSTMEDIRRVPEPSHGAVVFAGFQSLGRGRVEGRRWGSQEGRNLLMTLRLEASRIAHPFYQIPLLTGLALAEFLEADFALTPTVKWPNDVLVEGRKISGILCEAAPPLLFVGIGLNCGQTRFDEAYRGKSTSLALLSEGEHEPRVLLPRLLAHLQENYSRPRWRERLLPRLHGLDREVFLREGDPKREAVLPVWIRDLSPEGFLVVEESATGRRRSVPAGEILFPGYHL